MDDAFTARVEHGRKAVEEQIEYFAKQFGSVESDWKSDGSRVTEADLHISIVLADQLLEKFPNDLFLSEELDHGEEDIEMAPGYAWLLDPIDGTSNFARGIPTCAISLALLRNGFPVYGFIYDFASGRLLHGGEGMGLYVEDRKVERPTSEISEQSLVCQQCLVTDSTVGDESALQRHFKIRAFGSSALHMAYAALGWTDGVIAQRVKSWDIAAGVAMMKEAGGCTRYFDTEVFPLTRFSSKEPGFGHIAGTAEMCDAIEEVIGCKCAFSDEG